MSRALLERRSLQAGLLQRMARRARMHVTRSHYADPPKAGRVVVHPDRPKAGRVVVHALCALLLSLICGPACQHKAKTKGNEAASSLALSRALSASADAGSTA